MHSYSSDNREICLACAGGRRPFLLFSFSKTQRLRQRSTLETELEKGNQKRVSSFDGLLLAASVSLRSCGFALHALNRSCNSRGKVVGIPRALELVLSYSVIASVLRLCCAHCLSLLTCHFARLSSSKEKEKKKNIRQAKNIE